MWPAYTIVALVAPAAVYREADCIADTVAFGVAAAEGAAAEPAGVAEAEGAAAEPVVVALEVVAEEVFVLVVTFELAVAGAEPLLLADTLFVGAEAAEEVVAEGDADVVDGAEADVVGEGDADVVPEGVAVGAAEGNETEEDEGPAAVSTCCRYLGWKRKVNGVMNFSSSLFNARVLTAPLTHSRTTTVKQSFSMLCVVGDEGNRWLTT